MCVKGPWECVSTLKFRKGRWQWLRKNGVTAIVPLLHVLHLCDALALNEIHEVPPLARCIFADSWFASLKTVLALRDHLGLHFTGPIKTATSNYPIEAMRFTLSKMERGEHMVLKCLDVPDCWAVGWHDHYF